MSASISSVVWGLKTQYLSEMDRIEYMIFENRKRLPQILAGNEGCASFANFLLILLY